MEFYFAANSTLIGWRLCIAGGDLPWLTRLLIEEPKQEVQTELSGRKL